MWCMQTYLLKLKMKKIDKTRNQRTKFINDAIDKYFLFMSNTVHVQEVGLLSTIHHKKRDELIRDSCGDLTVKDFDVRADFMAWTSRPGKELITIVEVKKLLSRL